MDSTQQSPALNAGPCWALSINLVIYMHVYMTDLSTALH